MRFIVCTGDSHTWGQGATGLCRYFDPPVQGGELRPAPFGYGCYVNLLRNRINELSGSTAFEEEPRIELKGWYDTGKACDFAKFVLAIDGTYKIAYVSGGNSLSDLLDVRINDGKLSVCARKPCVLWRAEYYSGKYAVINAGVGSTTTERYLADYYDSYVKVLNPYMIIAEAHSINDWIGRIPPEKSCENIITILNGVPARKVLLTVSPIKGTTTEPFNEIDYTRYIDASYKAGKAAGVPIADGYKLPFGDNFDDQWHVNDVGHKLYYDEIMRVLDDIKLPGIKKLHA